MNIGGAGEQMQHAFNVDAFIVFNCHAYEYKTGALFYTCHANVLSPNSFCVQVQTHKTKYWKNTAAFNVWFSI